MIGNGNLGFLVSVSDRAGVVFEAGFVLVKKQQIEKTGGVISKQCSSSQVAIILKRKCRRCTPTRQQIHFR